MNAVAEDEQFDTIVIGAGISGETCARRLRRGGMRVALIESERIGGECAYWASLPTTSLLGPANAHWRAEALAGIASPALASPRSHTPSELLLTALDESAQVSAIEKEGGVFIRGRARFVRHDQVEVDVEGSAQRLQAPHIVVATGSAPAIPHIPGLSDSRFWTNREATVARAVPQQVAILGGEGQAIELAQMFRLYGADVTLITRQPRLLMDEDSDIGKLLARSLHRQGIRTVVGHAVVHVGRDADHPFVLALDDDTEIHTLQFVVATRRHPRIEGLQLANAGARYRDEGIVINETCRAADGVWAIGDVTGVGRLSHMAQYQARIAADDILGQPHPAQYASVPRILYTDPQVAVTGRTPSQMSAEDAASAISVAVALNEKKAYPGHQPENGRLTLYADVDHGVLIGAWAIATEASEWIQLAAHAIRSEIPLVVLRDMLEQFPPFGEIYLSAMDQLLAVGAQWGGGALAEPQQDERRRSGNQTTVG
jgi:pyruvate/2-oxoglutarate dehydrogenase complex dihydrolipoamide dehydrogenase (E3) component